ncbi:UDP-2,3-diacylglucosamine diphosphatase [Myroides guanonis]|uniref:UDP-2,3-diacylglucosamine hydrolase n=1 Tax=Myroides guanonis TaxID=1150112 RepID=A0A1I3T445_9FLAO|nr:UDP-2,3-diacylglucosamine diphosphatase [Myroides guanonis]SFJ65735.1 UDP-2,3-diacylglucosamine hydrolase [Myroides guanonis]
MNYSIQTERTIYFTSDHHFGAPTPEQSLPRETAFLEWLNEKEKDMGALFILGDLFDFWFEYKTVVPKGFVRILGKLAQLKDAGIPIYFFVGNHDLWMDDYFEKELGIPVFRTPQVFNINGSSFFIGHGDGLGPGDLGYKRMKKVFTNPFSKWLFRWLHPDIGVRLGQYLSVKNKLISGDEDVRFLGEDNEWLVQYAKRKLETSHYDFFVFGHRHLPMTIKLNEKSTYVNLGDWIGYFSYATFSNSNLELKYYLEEKR